MKLGFLGIGRIATAVIKGLCTSNSQDITINISPRNNEKSILLERSFPNVIRMDSNQAVLDNSEFIFVALPPGISRSILKGLTFSNNHTVISFVPFVEHAELEDAVKPARKTCRAIPLPTVEKHNCPIPVFNSNQPISSILKRIGTPITIENESELHTLWTLTGLIAPFYDLCETLSQWAQAKGIKASVADEYIMTMVWSLTSPTQKEPMPNFSELKDEATTPNGMNDQALKMINDQKAHKAYQMAAESVLDRFTMDK